MSVRRRLLLVAAATASVIAGIVGLSLPPRALSTAPVSWTDGAVRGAYHVHSVRSDGSGTLDEIAEAASRAGLRFVVITDHGDGTRTPTPPSYRQGVLIIDAVEISTTAGHYVALGLTATPYPLAGAPSAVVEDVRRLGGFGIVAHPGSSRPSLRWTAWDEPVAGIEWLNADSEWRDEVWNSLGRTILTYAFRSPETLASLLDRPEEVLARWDALGATRNIPAFAGADAHARIGLRQRTDPDAATVHVPLPGYEASFRAFSNHVVPSLPLDGDAGADATRLIDAMAAGRAFTVVDGLATPGAFEFSGESDGVRASMGDALSLGDHTTLHARITAPPNTTLMLIRNGATVRTTDASRLDADVTGQSGVYRVEARLTGAPGHPPIPWIVSNPIYVGLRRPAPPSSVVSSLTEIAQAGLPDAGAEMGKGCTSEIRRAGAEGNAAVVWRYALGAGTPAGQFAAVSIRVGGGVAAFDRVRLRVSAERPVRLWFQLRAPIGLTERWGTTFYADPVEREIDLPLAGLLPIGVTSTLGAPLDKVNSLLIVADTLNTLPGTSARVTIAGVALIRRR